jgi:hypothetical protein
MLQLRNGELAMNDGSEGPSGAHAMRAWTGALDAWWEMVLADSRRVRELASRLAGVEGGGANPGVSAEDLASVLQALEIVQRRLDSLDEQMGVLAEGLSQVVQHLQQTDGDAGEGE